MKYRIEPMRIEDFDAVIALWQGTEGVGLNESDTRPAIASYLSRNRGMSFVARSGDAIVGAVLCGHDGRRGYLHHLAVAPAHRRRGLGKKLVDSCLAQLVPLGILKCNIFLFADNADGLAFWRYNGWTTRGDLQVLQKQISKKQQANDPGLQILTALD